MAFCFGIVFGIFVFVHFGLHKLFMIWLVLLPCCNLGGGLMPSLNRCCQELHGEWKLASDVNAEVC